MQVVQHTVSSGYASGFFPPLVSFWVFSAVNIFWPLPSRLSFRNPKNSPRPYLAHSLAVYSFALAPDVSSSSVDRSCWSCRTSTRWWRWWAVSATAPSHGSKTRRHTSAMRQTRWASPQLVLTQNHFDELSQKVKLWIHFWIHSIHPFVCAAKLHIGAKKKKKVFDSSNKRLSLGTSLLFAAAHLRAFDAIFPQGLIRS